MTSRSSLGRNGRISVFPSERTLARYLADEHDHDPSDLSTHDDIRTAATDGSLRVDVTDDNVYVLSGLADDIADGPRPSTAINSRWWWSSSATSVTTRGRHGRPTAGRGRRARAVGEPHLNPESTNRPNGPTRRRSPTGRNSSGSWSRD